MLAHMPDRHDQDRVAADFVTDDLSACSELHDQVAIAGGHFSNRPADQWKSSELLQRGADGRVGPPGGRRASAGKESLNALEIADGATGPN